MQAHIKYLFYVLRHKWYVFQAGRVLGVPLWQLIIHDLSKFSRAEWGPYVRRFYGGRGGVLDKAADSEEFRQAWAHHWQYNPHHPELWAGGEQGDPYKRVPMPARFVAEMVADWYGAAMAQGKEDCWAWYRKNRDRYPIRDEAHKYVEECLLTLQDAGLIRSEFAGPDSFYTLK
jgi:hypothetical protein